MIMIFLFEEKNKMGKKCARIDLIDGQRKGFHMTYKGVDKREERIA